MFTQHVSVVVTTYNRDDMLAEALASLANQTLPLGEVVVVDDGGPGSARQVVEAFGARFHYVWQPNGGMQRARNTGIRQSKGDWIAFLDDDDLWEANRHGLIQELISTGQVDLISGDFRKFDSHGLGDESFFSELQRYAPDFWDGISRLPGQTYSIIGSFPTSRLFPVSPFWPSTLVVRRDLLEKLGGWDESLRGVKCEDVDFAFRAIKAGKLGLFWVPTIRYRSHLGNDSGEGVLVSLGRVHVWEHLLKKLYLDEAERGLIQKAISNSLLEANWSAFAKGDYKLFIEISRRLGWCNLSNVDRSKLFIAKILSYFQ